MMQYFHWYFPQDGDLWNQLKNESPRLAKMGINSLWLPPAFKASAGGYSVGYDVYDLFDLGEFDQKQTVRTKYGTRQEYIDAVQTATKHGIQVYADIVINHLAGADETEKITVVKVNPDDRNEPISEPYEIEAFTKFTYPGRKQAYSDFVWDHQCFSGIDYDHSNQETGIYVIQNEAGEGWEEMVDSEKGNYDYLMFTDVEFRNPAVRDHLKYWGKWYKETVGFHGVRLDAVKHISPKFYNEWLYFMRAEFGDDFFAVGEYWAPGNLELLQKYIDATEGKISLFDSSLQHKFHLASNAGSDFNLGSILENTLMIANPTLAVTVVDNHDTQPLQSLEAPVAAWFKPLAYALILLRDEGYPCIFYPDVYGAKYIDKGSDGNDHEIVLEPVACLEKLIEVRKHNCGGNLREYMDHENCVGWTWEGETDTGGCAIIMSNGDSGHKRMEIGKIHARKRFVDLLGHAEGEILIEEDGFAEFYCPAGAVSVWGMHGG